MSDTSLALGKLGEQIAADYLESKGYHILARNYRTSLGEIDLVAEIKDTLVFVEVKSRSSTRYGEGYEAVNAAKQKKLRQLALIYLQEHGQRQRGLRFDVLSLLISREGQLLKLQHFETAF